MRYLKKIKGVKKYCSFKEDILYSDKNDTLFLNNKVLQENIDGSSIFKINENLIQIYSLQKGYFYFKDNKILFSEFYIPQKTKNLSLALSPSIRISRGIYQKEIVLINLLDFSLVRTIKEKVKKNLLFSNDEIFVLNDNIHFEAYTLPKANFKWQFSLEPLGTYSNKYTREEKPHEIGHFIGVWQKELLIACTGSLILSLDIATGKEIRRWQNLPNTIDDFLKDVFESKIPGNEYIYHLNKAEDSIIAYFLSYQLHINLASGNITITNYKEALAEKHIEHFQYKSGYAEDDTHLYTTVNYDGKALGLKYTPTGIIAFNKLKGTVDWDFRFDTIKGDYISTQVPQYANGKLYQLTQDKNLYIFEKENLNG